MTLKYFNSQHKKIIQKYNVGCQWDCDYERLAIGMCYYGKDENDKEDEWSKFIVHITGIGFDSDGKLIGDFKGYLALLRKELLEFYKF